MRSTMAGIPFGDSRHDLYLALEYEDAGVSGLENEEFGATRLSGQPLRDLLGERGLVRGSHAPPF